MENLININPFTDDFVKQEIDFMQYDMTQDQIDFDGIVLKFKTIRGRCDDYLNVQYHIDDWKSPIMWIDGKLWMSLTTMEIQSSFMSWWPMEGEVAMLGLGTGYTALRAANNEQVDHVTVYEIDERVVEFFRYLHGDREECQKIEFVIGDARQKLKNKTFDCVFADIYRTLFCDEVQTDISLFLDNNNIAYYRFWGQEFLQVMALDEGIIPVHALSMIDLDYLRHWQSTESSKMHLPHVSDIEWITKTIQIMGQYPDAMYLDGDVFNMEATAWN